MATRECKEGHKYPSTERCNPGALAFGFCSYRCLLCVVQTIDVALLFSRFSNTIRERKRERKIETKGRENGGGGVAIESGSRGERGEREKEK